ncbi:2OG-Fe(II) oxygenase [Flexithrix dorotheae]|uniref:2OG-Fe(II) oxygenase n=1 Tax=Flexithrix dorotheae TaxID=70993 RepID=UPI000365A15E|nr:2OG-Fe(II) oxygenase [Flexithrix dorotheae]
MENLKTKLAKIDWQSISESINEKGYAIIPKTLSEEQCLELIQKYNNENLYRKTVVMERYRFGLGEYKYFDYPLPIIIQTLRETIYPILSPIANLWMKVLNIDKVFPETFEDLQSLCHQNNQLKPTPLILKYGIGGFNTLHQDLYGEIYFPMQCVLFLNEPDKDFKGGEFVLTQQTPRAQSKAIVLRPQKGDMLIFTTNFRPIKGTRGYYQVNMKHGVSEVISGERHTLGVIFHDANS